MLAASMGGHAAWHQGATAMPGTGGFAAGDPLDRACAREVGKFVRRRTEHDAADSPLTSGSPGRSNDCWNASESPQAACGPSARAPEDGFATRAVHVCETTKPLWRSLPE